MVMDEVDIHIGLPKIYDHMVHAQDVFVESLRPETPFMLHSFLAMIEHLYAPTLP